MSIVQPLSFTVFNDQTETNGFNEVESYPGDRGSESATLP